MPWKRSIGQLPCCPLADLNLPPCTPPISHYCPSPPQPPPAHLPQKGNRVSIPLSAVLLYSDKVLQVVQGGIVLRRICQVTRLIFWTGFNGTRIFTGSAPVPQGEIFGGGEGVGSRGVLTSGSGIEGFHCIQGHPHFRGVE